VARDRHLTTILRTGIMEGLGMRHRPALHWVARSDLRAWPGRLGVGAWTSRLGCVFGRRMGLSAALKPT
jgi:hypothetical protein